MSGSINRMRPIHAVLVGVFAWMVAIAVLGARLVWDLTAAPWLSGVELSKPAAAGIVVAVCLGSTILAWRLRPTSTLAVALGSAAVIVLTAAFVTGSMLALAVVVATAFLAWLIGEAIIGGYFPAVRPYLARAVVAFALGNGLLGLMLLLLGSMGRLDSGSLVATLSVVAAAAIVVIRRSRQGTTRWTPVAATWWEAAILGTVSGLVAFALLTSFIPETISDAVREHLPVTREIWQTGSTSGLAWTTARLPIHAQLVSVLAWAAGGDVGVKLSHALVGLAAVAGVGSLGWLLSGRTAALVAAAVFATIPIVQWEMGHAYVDLYPALFCTASAVAVVVWQQSGRRSMLVVAGALAGFSFATKVVSASAIAALGFAVAVVGRARWSLRERAFAVASFVLGGLAYLPWLIWSYQKTGSIPGIDYAVGALLNPASDIVGNLDEFGIGRELLSALAIPWAATFQGELFSEAGAGNLGILPLMLLPAILFAPRSRSTAFVAAAALTAYLGWAFSAQYFRYGLPLFALTCALIGAGAANLAVRLSKIGEGRSVHLLHAILLVGLAITPLLTMSNWLFRIPPSYFTGRLSREQLLAAYVSGFRVFDRSSAIVGAGNNLGWVGFRDIPRIFTEAHVVELSPPAADTPTSEVLASLRALDVSYFAWERSGSDSSAWRSPMLSLSFLRDHTDIAYAADNTYLFEVFDEPHDRWGVGAESILSPTPGQSPEDSEWTQDDGVTMSGTSMVLSDGAGLWHETVVRGGTPYLLVAKSRCGRASDPLIVALHWRSAEGPLGMEWQLVNPGENGSEQFLWAIAPEAATSALVQVSAWGDGVCMVDDVALHEGRQRSG